MEELKKKLAEAASLEELVEIVRADGAEISADEAAGLWEKIAGQREQEGRTLSPEELEAVSGGADRNWLTDGCASTVEGGSLCWSNDQCSLWDVTYDNYPIKDPCPVCGGTMYRDTNDPARVCLKCGHRMLVTREPHFR